MVNINNTIISNNEMPFFKGIFFTCVFMSALQVHGQFFEGIRASFNEQPVVDVKIDTRNSFIATRLARISGIKVGLDFGGKVRLGLGYNQLMSRIRDKRIVAENGRREEVNYRYRFWYLSPYMEYTFLEKSPWEASILVLLGAGRSSFTYDDLNGLEVRTPGDFVFLYEPYMTGQYRVLKYLGLGAGVGYRLAYSKDRFSRNQLNSPIYVFKLKVYVAELYDNFKN